MSGFSSNTQKCKQKCLKYVFEHEQQEIWRHFAQTSVLNLAQFRIWREQIPKIKYPKRKIVIDPTMVGTKTLIFIVAFMFVLI